MLPEYFEFSLPTKLVYGIGIVENLGETVKPLGKRKAILVTDEILVKTGLVKKVKSGFKATPIKIAATFDQVPPNSTIDTVEKCAALARRKGCDMFIAVGGGSVIDTAKVANLLAVKGGKLQDHMGAYLLDSSETLFPAIVIPTTAGTGSEVTKVAVIADPDNDVKLPFAEDQFLPYLAILDPNMTVSMPGKLTAATGMDALTHAIEAYVDKEWSPASDALALHAITLISGNILQACAKPNDLQARGAMQVGSFLAGVAFSHSMVGMVHGIAHALGGVYHIPHGLANALVLPEVMAYNLEARIDRYADIALAMGISFPQVIGQSRSLLRSSRLDIFSKIAGLSDVDSLKELVTTSSHQARNKLSTVIGNLGFIDTWVRRQAALAAVEKIRCLNQQLAYLTKMPLNLKDAGISDNLEKIEQVATIAMEDGAMLYNPIEPERDAVIEIIKKVYDAKRPPLPVSKEDLRPLATAQPDTSVTNVFKDAKMLYEILVEFYELLKNNPEIGPKLAQSNLCVQFRYKNPSAVITIDATGDDLKIIQGEFDGEPEVVLTMNADFAHAFWHGKANLVSALTRRQVKAKGNVPKTIKLLPILKPSYALYPKFLADKGLRHLVMT
ncbi:MAG: iron-containing alcohol dehydrogenase [Desulfobacteraceae bacterium]|nr:iron-containing alcohol dehydrogenase [Desulfobacteraceae bacterium]MBC2752960.1 iron-containing alcohol dehydrogenase [Desulfobacteraceae bacterium]